jgi:hypothetical protein
VEFGNAGSGTGTGIATRTSFIQFGFYLSNGVTDTLESSSILIYSELDAVMIKW